MPLAWHHAKKWFDSIKIEQRQMAENCPAGSDHIYSESSLNNPRTLLHHMHYSWARFSLLKKVMFMSFDGMDLKSHSLFQEQSQLKKRASDGERACLTKQIISLQYRPSIKGEKKFPWHLKILLIYIFIPPNKS